MSNLIRAFYVSIISILLGSLQMAFFLFEGVSCSDGKSSLLDGILFFMPIQFAIVLILSLIRKNILHYLLIILIFVFWIFINKHEFEHRYACWSTFSDEEIIKTVLLKSSYTCSSSIILFYFFTRKFFRK